MTLHPLDFPSFLSPSPQPQQPRPPPGEKESCTVPVFADLLSHACSAQTVGSNSWGMSHLFIG